MNVKNITLRTYFFAVLILTVSACHSLKPVSSGSGRSSSTTTKSASDSVSELRKDITKYALRQKGAKYKYGAKGPKKFDCSGLTAYVYTANNVDLPNGSYNQAKVGKKVSLSKAKPGDLVFFGKRGKVNHVALIIKNSSAGLEVVHSTSGSGVIQENISKSSYWKPRILYARNVIGR